MNQKKKIKKTSAEKRLEKMVITDNIPEGGRLNVSNKLILEFFKKEIIEALIENDGKFPKPKPRKPVPRSYMEYKNQQNEEK